MNFFSKWWPSILSVVTVVAGLVSTPVQGAIAAHPTVSAVLAGVLGILSHFVPSPLQPSSAQK